MLDINPQDHDEVVALYIDEEIYFGQAAVDKAKQTHRVDGLLFRKLFQFMAQLDLSPKWAEYAQYPTLFTITDYNEWSKLPEGKPIC